MFKNLNSADKNDMDDDFSPSLKLYDSSSSVSSGSEDIKEEATKIMDEVKSRNCRMSQMACVGLKFSSEMSFDFSDEEGDEHSQFSRSMSDTSSFPSDDISEGTDNNGESLRKGFDFDRDDESEKTYYEGFQEENLLEKEKIQYGRISSREFKDKTSELENCPHELSCYAPEDQQWAAT